MKNNDFNSRCAQAAASINHPASNSMPVALPASQALPPPAPSHYVALSRLPRGYVSPIVFADVIAEPLPARVAVAVIHLCREIASARFDS